MPMVPEKGARMRFFDRLARSCATLASAFCDSALSRSYSLREMAWRSSRLRAR